MISTSKYNKRLVFTAACLGMLLFGITMISIGTILPDIILKFELDEKMAGSLVTLLPLGLLAGSLVFGPVIDRYGYRHLLFICSLLIFAGLEGIAYSERIRFLRIAVFLTGFGGGVINGATNALVNDISEEGKSANLSFLGVFFGIGALGMPALIGILNAFFSKESIISVIGLVILIPVVYFFVIQYPAPKQQQGLPLKRVFKLLREPVLIFLGLILFFESGIEGITSNWTTTYLQRDHLQDNQQALFALSSFILSLTLTRLILGFLLKKIPSYLVLLTGIALTASGIILLWLTDAFGFSVAGLILIGMGCAAAFPVILSYAGELYSEFSGTAFSVVMVIAVTGNTIINYLMGIVAHQSGIGRYINVLFISLMLMLILLVPVLINLKNKIKI